MSEKNNNPIKEFLITILCMLIFAWVIFVFGSYISLYSAASRLKKTSQQEFLRVRIYGSSSSLDGNTISASFSIVDKAGNEIAVIERSWSGNYLAVDFEEAAFPSEI